MPTFAAIKIFMATKLIGITSKNNLVTSQYNQIKAYSGTNPVVLLSQ